MVKTLTGSTREKKEFVIVKMKTIDSMLFDPALSGLGMRFAFLLGL
jgi:hypothetical protein